MSDVLDPTRVPKMTRAMKAEKTVHRVTYNPSKANPGETLYITIPRMHENMLLVPRSLFLRFNVKMEMGHVDNHLVFNVSRNLVVSMKVVFGAETICDIDRYDLFYGYQDMLMVEDDQMRGIATADKRKARTKVSSVSKIKNLTSVAYGDKYNIPLSHPILDDQGVFYPGGLKSELKFEVKLAKSDQIVVVDGADGASKDKNGYELHNIELEYSTIFDEDLAYRAKDIYDSGRTFYFEDVHLFTTENSLNLGTQTFLNVHVNVPRRCMKGVKLLFLKTPVSGKRNTTEFVNPIIGNVQVSINGVPHTLFSDGMKRTDL